MRPSPPEFFTLDQDSARAKMREFQLADARHYILHLIQAGGALEATAIEVETDGRQVQVRLRGAKVGRDFLDHPFHGLFIRQERFELQGLRSLAIGLNAALAASPSRLTITSSGCQATVGVKDVKIATVPDDGDTVIVLKERWRWRRPIPPEDGILRDHAGWGPVPLTLNQVPLRSEFGDRPVLETIGKIEVWLGEHPGLVHFIRYGVKICTRRLVFPVPGMNAVIAAEGLMTNLSGADLIEDDRYTDVLRDLEQACSVWMVGLCEGWEGASDEMRPRLRRQLLQALAGESLERLPGVIQGLSLFESTTGKMVSLRELRAWLQGAKLIWDGTGVRITEPWDISALEKVFGRAPAQQLIEGPEGQARAPVKLEPAPLTDTDGLFTVAFTAGDVIGSIALSPSFRTDWGTSNIARIRFMQHSQTLGTSAMSLEFGPLQGVVDSPRLTSLSPGPNLDEALEALRVGAAKLAVKVAEGYEQLTDFHRLQARRFILSYLRYLSREQPLWEVAPPELLDAPLLEGPGGHTVALRQLQGRVVIRWVPTDPGSLETNSPILVCEEIEAERVAAVTGAAKVENWEQELVGKQAREDFHRRPLQELDKVTGFFVQALDQVALHARVGYLPPHAGFDGQSDVRFVLRGHLLETIRLSTIVPVDAVVAAEGLMPNDLHDKVERDGTFAHTVELLGQAIQDGLHKMLDGYRAEMSSSLVLWALAQVRKPSDMVREPADTRLGRALDLPLLTDSCGLLMTLREAACQAAVRGRFYWVPKGVQGEPLDARLLVAQLADMELTAVRKVFRKVTDYRQRLWPTSTPRWQRPDSLLSGLQQCLRALPRTGWRWLDDAAVAQLSTTDQGPLCGMEGQRLQVNSSHAWLSGRPLEPETVALLAVNLFVAVRQGDTTVTEADEAVFIGHVAHWLEGCL
ncbi:MAG TPA: hypothetical protein VGO93_31745 [Candidatus Xenobia bacterium]